MSAHVTPSAREGRTDLLLYGSVHFGKTLLWVGEDALAFYLMVGLLALPPGLAGSLFLASALLNAACDGLFGQALARWPVLSRHLPAMLWLVVPACGVSFAALPFLPVGNLLSVIALLLLFRTTFSMADVPHNALTHVLAARHGHLAIARIRAFLSGSASLVIAFVAFLLLGAADGEAPLVKTLIGMIGVGALALMIPLPFLVRRFRDMLPAGPASPGGRGAARPSLLLFCLVSAIGIAALATLGKAILHIEFEVPAIGAAALVLITAGRLGSIWIWSPLARRIGNRRALSLAYLASGLTAFLLPGMASSAFGAGTAVLLVLAGVTGGGIALLSWAVLSELIAARSRGVPGSRHVTGFSLFTMSTKVALGLSGVMVGAWLSTRSDALHADPSAFSTLAAAVFLMSGLTAVLNCRTGLGDSGLPKAIRD